MKKTPKDKSLRVLFYNGREDRTRTCDPLVPNQVHYQIVLLLDNNDIIPQIGAFATKISGAPKGSRTPNL